MPDGAGGALVGGGGGALGASLMYLATRFFGGGLKDAKDLLERIEKIVVELAKWHLVPDSDDPTKFVSWFYSALRKQIAALQKQLAALSSSGDNLTALTGELVARIDRFNTNIEMLVTVIEQLGPVIQQLGKDVQFLRDEWKGG